MKIGVRKPSVKKRIKARTTGKIKRKIKKATNPFYGKKGMGMIKDPKKSVYNKVYRKTTVSVDDLFKSKPAKKKKKSYKNNTYANKSKAYREIQRPYETKQLHSKDNVAGDWETKIGCGGLLALFIGFCYLFSNIPLGILLLLLGILCVFIAGKIQAAKEKKSEEIQTEYVVYQEQNYQNVGSVQDCCALDESSFDIGDDTAIDNGSENDLDKSKEED